MKVYVGNLARDVTDAELHDLAVPFGEPHCADIARELSGGASKGFGFIEYATEQTARAAITGLDGRDVHGQILTVRRAIMPAPAAPVSVLKVRRPR
ncbi:MAG TPA: RNA-binding protein [Thermoanaerobaculia bacterium]|jgi:RNA recognition motif-containing protein|nr:RNA-binding protein [Thermoanaerobaculia bacterium]